MTERNAQAPAPPCRAETMAATSQQQGLRIEMLDKMSALMTAAFGLVAALAWNEAILALFQQVFGAQTALGPKVGYAVLVTILAVLLVIWVGRAAGKAKESLARA